VPSIATPSSGSDQPTGAGADPFRGTPYRAVRLDATHALAQSFVVAHRVTGRQFRAKVQAADHAGNLQLTERMRIDAQALGSLDHVNIVKAISAGHTGDTRFYVVTEYVDGRSLQDELEERGRIPFLEAIGYACDLLSALSAAHALGIVHRDPSPSSVTLCSAPTPRSRPFLKITSFLAAKISANAPEGAPAPLSPATDPNIILGVPLFVSPEMVTRGTADARSDIYSAALLLYLMIAGKGPYDHLRTAIDVFRAQVVTVPAPLSAFAEVPLPPELDRVVAKALRKDPAGRFQTADEFREALERITREPTAAEEHSESGRDLNGETQLRTSENHAALTSANPEPLEERDDAEGHRSEREPERARTGDRIQGARALTGLLILFVLAGSAVALIMRSVVVFAAGRL
jgi:serine/threonine protein kinase